jgi:DNA-binding transcriptional ArsR family regulator
MKQDLLTTKVKFLRGFGDRTRILILESIQHSEKKVSQIIEEVQASQSSVSQHLACLKECGLITGRQDGKYIYYSLSSEKIRQLLDVFNEVFAEVQTNVACCERHFEAVEE